MRAILTDPMVRGLRKKGTAVDVWDALAAGLLLRIGRSGTATWAYRYRTPGGRAGTDRRYTIAPYKPFGVPGEAALTITEARAKATELREAIKAGADPARATVDAPQAQEGPAVLTLAALVDQALDALRPPRVAPSTHEEWVRLARVELVPWRGQDPAAAIRRKEAREFLRGIVARGSPSTANHTLDCARRLYSWAIREELLDANPWAGLESPAPRRQSERVLSLEEVRAVWRALDVLSGERKIMRKERAREYAWTVPGRPAACDVVRLLLLTAVRLDAALGLQRREVEGLDGPAPVWIVPPERVKARTGKRRPHMVPLSKPAAELLRRRLAGGDVYAFPASRGATGPMAWVSAFVKLLREEAARQLGRPMEGWTVHGLRHAAATHMRESIKVRADVVSALLGHVQAGPVASRIYNRAELLDERREALEAWAGLVGAQPFGNSE
jgi:integrase